MTIVALFGLTGAKVGALWPQQQAESQRPGISPASSAGLPAVIERGHLDSHTRGLMERLNKRLQGTPDDF